MATPEQIRAAFSAAGMPMRPLQEGESPPPGAVMLGITVANDAEGLKSATATVHRVLIAHNYATLYGPVLPLHVAGGNLTIAFFATPRHPSTK